MRVRTRSGTIYRIDESQDAQGPHFTVTRIGETEPNPNGLPIGYAASTRALTIRIGEPIAIEGRIDADPSEWDDPPSGLYTTPVVAILRDPSDPLEEAEWRNEEALGQRGGGRARVGPPVPPSRHPSSPIHPVHGGIPMHDITTYPWPAWAIRLGLAFLAGLGIGRLCLALV